MKKLFLMVAVMMIAATASFAQLGVRIGANFASVTNNDFIKTSPGIHLGAVYNIELADALSLQPGAYVSFKNFHSETDILGENLKIKYHPMYLHIPILVKYNLDLGDIALDPHVGPYFAFGVGGKAKIDDYKSKVFGKGEDDLNMKRFDMGLGVGCGATFFDAVYLGLDYEFGFTDLVKNNHGDAQRMGNFMVTFGVWIN